MNVIDFFSGCGGLSYGFVQAGYDVIIGIDNNFDALKTFEYNHPKSKGLLLDLFSSDFMEKLEKEVENRSVDIIIGGPPCQGFSLSGSRDQKDKRNLLFKSMFDAVDKYKPKVILIENVPGLKTLYGGYYYNQIIIEFEKRKYQWEAKVLYAPEYGVPQIRKRLFFIATREDIKKIVHPEKVISNPENYITTGEAISDLPNPEDNLCSSDMEYKDFKISNYAFEMRNGSNKIHNHTPTKHSNLVISVISQVPEGGNYKDLPDGVGNSRRFNEAWTRYHRNKPSKTIDTGHRNHFHYEYNRVPTVRENARLQSFPDTFVFFGSKTEQYKQVGNAVPPKLGFYIAKTIKEQIGNE